MKKEFISSAADYKQKLENELIEATGPVQDTVFGYKRTSSQIDSTTLIKELEEALKRQKTASYEAQAFADCKEDPLKKMMMQLGITMLDGKNILEKALATFTKCMSDAGFKANNLQGAAALNAIHRWKNKQRLMMVVPAGMGKTRISLATCIGLMTRLLTDKIVVVYLNEILKKQDEEPWIVMEEYMRTNKKGNDVKVYREVGWNKALEHAGNNTIYIIDEADKLFVDDAVQLPAQYKSVIAFTATVPQNNQDGIIVQERLKDLRFEVVSDLGFA